MRLIDVHAHLNDSRFDSRLDEVVSEYRAVGVDTVIVSGYDVDSSVKAKDVAEKYDGVYFSAGVHPDDARLFDDEAEEVISTLATHPKCVAIGEIGYDFYWKKSTEDQQRDAFIRQMRIADEVKKPFVVHSREASKITLDTLRESKSLINSGFLMHCYAGSAEDVKNYAELGGYFSLGGVITFKNAKKELVVENIPSDRLLTETDCPYLTPEPFRGTENRPALIRYVLEKIASVRGEDKEITAKLIADNAKNLFGV